MLDDWEQRCASLMFGGGLPFSVFHSPKWKRFFLLISGGRFSGPGDPRKVGSSRLDTASGKVAARVHAAVRAADTVALTPDGAGDVNGKTTYNVVWYLPRTFLLGSFRLGVVVASALNLPTRKIARYIPGFGYPKSRVDEGENRSQTGVRHDQCTGFPGIGVQA